MQCECNAQYCEHNPGECEDDALVSVRTTYDDVPMCMSCALTHERQGNAVQSETE